MSDLNSNARMPMIAKVLSPFRLRLLAAVLPLAVGLLAAPAHAAPAKTSSRPFFAKAAAGGAPDTLDVFVLYIEFKAETDADDEAGTTGHGIFGSDKDITSYKLDPNGSFRGQYPHYLL
ncbi:MAG TPA: hypothetical protein VHO02_09010, partial [Fibrobacteria bacterium]|nr:hypothetical protein [Fibrobacteria bacterium]